MKRFVVLLILFAAGCMTANDSGTCPDPVAKTVHDTVNVEVLRMDTLRIHDSMTVTLRDTIKIHDTSTITVHDTILASLPDPTSLYGVWEGQASGQKVVLAFTSSVLHEADFSVNIGTASNSGYIAQVDSAQAKVVWAGYKDVTWLIDLRASVLMIQEIGNTMFPGGAVTLHKR